MNVLTTHHDDSRLILVDRDDNPVGVADKVTIHEQGLLHRAFSIFIFREAKYSLELLIQQRNLEKYHSGGLWTNTVCSHPREGESLEIVTKRRLMEEMGISAQLSHVGEFMYRAQFPNGLIEYEYDHVFVGHDEGGVIEPNPEEIAQVRWAEVNRLRSDLSVHPELYTPWFEQALVIALDALKVCNI